MRILIVTQYFWPETFIINDLARALVANGHHVTVATGKPNYPTGRIAPGYRKHGIMRETYAEKIDILRVPLRPRGKGGIIGLSLNYVSFVLSGLLRFPFHLRNRDFDTVLFFGPSPMTSAIPAALMALIKRAHLALWIQDLWPESLAATGLIRNRIILRVIGLVVRAIYSRADTLLLQSVAFFEPLAHYADIAKFVYFPNPAPSEEPYDALLPDEILACLENCFPIVFAGNLGRAQSLETILEAADQLREETSVRFIIAGHGSEAVRLQDTVKRLNLPNVVMIGSLERHFMPALFRRAGALLVTLKDDPAFNTVVPSKIQAYMQAGKPIVGALSGEGARLIDEAGCGLTVPAGDGKGLAKTILTLSLMPDNRLTQMGLAGRRFFEDSFEIGIAARQLIRIIETRSRSEKK